MEHSMTDSRQSSEEEKGEHATEEVEVEVVSTSDPSEPLKGFRLFMILLGLRLPVFCVALDNTIIATAIPYITDQFRNLSDIGWYGSVYLLTTCSFQLLYGKLYKYFSIVLVFLTGLFIFEVGSLICAVAPNSMTLIIGSKSYAAARSPSIVFIDLQQGIDRWGRVGMVCCDGSICG